MDQHHLYPNLLLECEDLRVEMDLHANLTATRAGLPVPARLRPDQDVIELGPHESLEIPLPKR